MIVYSNTQLEAAEEGRADLVACAVTYEGPRASIPSTQLHQGDWPGQNPLVRGVTYVALVPDSGLGYLETRSGIGVSYDPADIAAAILGQNYLPTAVFGAGFDARVQERVLDALGIEFAGTHNEAGNREALRALVDGESDAAESTEPDSAEQTYVEMLVDEHTRGELKDAAQALREDTSEISLKATKTELAEWLADQDRSAVADELEG